MSRVIDARHIYDASAALAGTLCVGLPLWSNMSFSSPQTMYIIAVSNPASSLELSVFKEKTIGLLFQVSWRICKAGSPLISYRRWGKLYFPNQRALTTSTTPCKRLRTDNIVLQLCSKRSVFYLLATVSSDNTLVPRLGNRIDKISSSTVWAYNAMKWPKRLWELLDLVFSDGHAQQQRPPHRSNVNS